jgi:general secretion pathway protein K
MKACSDAFNRPHPARHDLSGERGGVALILVIWVVVILIAIAGEFTYSIRTDLTITRNFKEEEEAYHSALAGIELAKLEIHSLKQPYHVYHNEEGALIFEKEEEEEPPVREGDLGNSSFSYTLTDESGKLNINTASEVQLKELMRNIGIDSSDVDTIADSILDWHDENELHRLNGAEEDYYRSLDHPYSSKDGPFDIIDELLLVKGVTPEIYYGTVDDNEDEDEDDNEIASGGISGYLTTWGSRNININTASEEVLKSVLGTAVAENIIIQREAGPILRARAGGTITSNVFTVESTGRNRDGSISRTIRMTLRKLGKKIEVLYWNDNVIG